ncbi:hypothetical protein H5410_025901 [Solanum commersonii]|uniref:Uncharacterized protein n=1 Tax=Solanum commersonii TaxID=4109 RepID=A0A9J5YV15_SOLCO|nr:hypothetical protein H5410_025901 [Solanum commersonii]
MSDIGIEDTIVDNRKDNGVDKNFLIEENSTKVVLQGIRGDVTNEVDEEFSDPDYNLSDEDDDFQNVIDDQKVLIDDQQVLVDDQQVLIDDQQVKKVRGRPRNASVNVPVSFEILVPLQNADVESDYAYSDELPDDDVQSDKGENNGQEYDESKNKNFPIFELGMKFKNFKQFKEACRELGLEKPDKRAAKIRKRRPQKLSKKGSTQVMCLICKKYEHNARGHYKFVKARESSSSHYLEAISPAQAASNGKDYLNMYHPKMWSNNHQGLNLAYQSTITQAPIEKHVIVVQTDVVAAQGVDEIAIKGIETIRLSHTSKRDRLFKRKVMKEYIVELQKKKKKIGNHSKV